MEIEIALDVRNGVGEGPFWDEAGQRLLWVDITQEEVLGWRPAGGALQRWRVRGLPCAVIPCEREGAVVALRDGLHLMDLGTGALAPFCRPEADRPGNRSNEAKCDAAGRLWLGTMQNNLEPDGSPRAMTASTGALYKVMPDGTSTREVDGVGLSNTLAWSPDGRLFYFGDTLANVISVFDCDPATGRIGGQRPLSGAQLPGACDGSAVDEEGCLWNARFGGSTVVRLAPDGRVDRIVEVPVTNPTSCCFGGPDLATLYVTSARFSLGPAQLRERPHEGALVAIRAGVRGTPSCRFKG
jgi:sugar lactone lactonase YvrE